MQAEKAMQIETAGAQDKKALLPNEPHEEIAEQRSRGSSNDEGLDEEMKGLLR